MSPTPRDVTLFWAHRVSLNGMEMVRRLRGSPRGLGAEAAIRESEGDWGAELQLPGPHSCSEEGHRIP